MPKHLAQLQFEFPFANMASNKVHAIKVKEVPKVVITKPNEKTVQVHQTQDKEQTLYVSILYYLSVFTGPIFAIISGSFLCLVPISNVLEQPEYWMLDQVTRVLAGCNGNLQNLFGTEYWADFKFKNRWATYLILTILQISTYCVVITIYNLIWTTGLGYYHPMPMSQHIGAFGILTAYHIGVWFRYANCQVQKCKSDIRKSHSKQFSGCLEKLEHKKGSRNGTHFLSIKVVSKLLSYQLTES